VAERPASAERPSAFAPRVRAIATALVSLVLLALAFRDVHPARVLAIVSALDYRWLALALVVDAGIFTVKALKWRYVFMPVARLPLGAFFSAIAVGALSITVLPLRLDELVRTYYLSRRSGIPPATVLGTIVGERVADATVLLAAVALVLMGLGVDERLTGAGLLLLVGTIVGASATLVLARRGALPGAATALVPASMTGLRARVHALALTLVDGLSAFPRGGRIAGLFGLELLEWAATVVYMQLVLRAFGLGVPLVGDLALVTAGYLSFAVPAAPGSLGVFELLMKGALSQGLALGPDQALGGALVLHFMLVVPISLAGALVLLRDGVSLLRLGALARAAAAGLPAEADAGR
jgi:uncharacterized protein (TIRG00374 family)